MADLLASLEIGMTRTSGAPQRLRSQVTRIDEYMATQRQQTLTHPPPGPSARLQGIPQHVDMFPSDQQQSHQGIQPVVYDFPQYSNGAGHLGNGQDFAQFQLPPELLDDWPWLFDMA